MVSPQKLLANKRNAKLSTGPRSQAGKKRSARNALRHGLNTPAGDHPAFQKSISQLALQLAGDQESQERKDSAVRLAKIFIEIGRVKTAFHLLYSGLKTNALVSLPTPTNTRDPIQDLVAKVQTTILSAIEDRHDASVENNFNEFIRLERYERRLASRLKRAIRAFDTTIKNSIE